MFTFILFLSGNSIETKGTIAAFENISKLVNLVSLNIDLWYKSILILQNLLLNIIL